jgi:hypothetical protein
MPHLKCTAQQELFDWPDTPHLISDYDVNRLSKLRANVSRTRRLDLPAYHNYRRLYSEWLDLTLTKAEFEDITTRMQGFGPVRPPANSPWGTPMWFLDSYDAPYRDAYMGIAREYTRVHDSVFAAARLFGAQRATPLIDEEVPF